MAVDAKRLISRCMSARFLLSGALSLVFCLSLAICQNQPNNNATFKSSFQAETKTMGILEEVKLFDPGARKDFVTSALKAAA